MSVDLSSKGRQLIPRWLPYEAAVMLGAVGGAGGARTLPPNFLDAVKRDWLRYESLACAIELVAAASVIGLKGENSVIAAAEKIVKSRAEVSSIAFDMARSYLGERESIPFSLNFLSQKDVICSKISFLKSRLKDFSANPIYWSDLAFYYGVIGEKERAMDCARIAYQLGSRNPFIVRNSSRAFLHFGDEDRALHVLRRFEGIKKAPSVLAAEIALSNHLNRPSKNISAAFKVAEDLSPLSLGANEINAVVASVEANDGSKKKAKRFLINSLAIPNENCLAQATWIIANKGIEYDLNMDVPANFEALANKLQDEGKYELALENCDKWKGFQPFSRHPAISGSYIASVALCDYERAEYFSAYGYQISPEDPTVANNYVCALALNGKLSEATAVLNSISLEDLDKDHYATFAATIGLVHFRRGEYEEGRKWYQRAVNIHEKLGNSRAHAVALSFWAEQEAEYDKQTASVLIEKAKRLAKKFDIRELDFRLGVYPEGPKKPLAF